MAHDERRAAFVDELRRARSAAGLSLADLAAAAHASRGYLHHVEHGRRWPSRSVAAAVDDALGARGALVQLWLAADGGDAPAERGADADELDAVELARRVAASDVGAGTLLRLETAVDELATAYPVADQAGLLQRVRTHVGYVRRLTAARATLDEHRRLLIVGGWLSLLAATLLVDDGRDGAAGQWLRTADDLAGQAGHAEIRAWCLETGAWSALTRGDPRRAVDLAQAAQQLAPRGSSAEVQATAQEGRSLARLGEARATYAAVDRVHVLAAALPAETASRHHYRYDPAKAVSYTATTLAWLGDPAAEGWARATIARTGDGTGGRWPRRAATARLDLALALLPAGRLDEAADATRTALESGVLAPSSRWRALEVVDAVAARGLPEASELREVYEAVGRG